MIYKLPVLLDWTLPFAFYWYIAWFPSYVTSCELCQKVTSRKFGIKTKAIVSGKIYIYCISTVNRLEFCITAPNFFALFWFFILCLCKNILFSIIDMKLLTDMRLSLRYMLMWRPLVLKELNVGIIKYSYISLNHPKC